MTKQGDERRRSEHRANSRYRLSSPPAVEILHDNVPVQARLRDLSRGGCYVETDCTLAPETEVAVTLNKDGDLVRTVARVVRADPGEGMALAFASMSGEDFFVLESWLATHVSSNWVAVNRRRANRVAVQIMVRVSGYTLEGGRFAEETNTVVVSAFGCSVVLRTPVRRGQRLVLSNVEAKRSAECLVAHREQKGADWHVGLAFTTSIERFWPIDFPPIDWSSRHPDAKRFDS